VSTHRDIFRGEDVGVIRDYSPKMKARGTRWQELVEEMRVHEIQQPIFGDTSTTQMQSSPEFKPEKQRSNCSKRKQKKWNGYKKRNVSRNALYMICYVSKGWQAYLPNIGSPHVVNADWFLYLSGSAWGFTH